MTDVFGKVLSLILAFVLLIIGPLTITLMMDEVQDRRTAMNEVSNFISEVADTRTLTDSQLENFYIGLSATSLNVDADIVKYVKIINPDPKNPGSTYTTYMATESLSEWKQGDVIKVTVKSVAANRVTAFVQNVVGMLLPEFEYTEAGRVR